MKLVKFGSAKSLAVSELPKYAAALANLLLLVF